jgi:hypothetical protein
MMLDSQLLLCHALVLYARQRLSVSSAGAYTIQATATLQRTATTSTLKATNFKKRTCQLNGKHAAACRAL